MLAGEEIKYPSPDGRFALRITQPKDDEYHPTVELIEKGAAAGISEGLKNGGVHCVNYATRWLHNPWPIANLPQVKALSFRPQRQQPQALRYSFR